MSLKIFKSTNPIPEITDDTFEITSITPCQKDQNRVNIFLDEKFAFTLNISQLLDFKIKVGTRITKEEKALYEKASNFGKLYQTTLNWIFLRPRSVKETRDYLIRKQRTKKEYAITNEEINLVLDKLLAKNYLNDRNFASFYIENRFRKKGMSRRRLEMELQTKGIKPEIIEDALLEVPRSDEEEIKKIIEKKRSHYDSAEKFIQYLVRQGFSYDLAKSSLESEGFTSE